MVLVRTNSGSGSDVKDAFDLVCLDGREEQLIADGLCHERMGQVEAILLKFIVG